ncbi:MAG: helix-turn-helix domain-containing protein, partial [Myxococcota bacterium]
MSGVHERVGPQSRVQLHACVVDLVTGSLLEGRTGKLSERERGLLAYLVARPRQVVPRSELAERVFGQSQTVSSRAVDKALFRLRGKVERDRSTPDHLLTRQGAGYVFVPLDGASPAPRETNPPSRREPCVSVALSPFVGRVRELAELTRAADAGRLVTVVGLGGVGKTRLAYHYASTWPRGDVAWCDLTAARTRDDVLRAMASALGTTLKQNPETALATVLSSRRGALVVVD